MCQRNEEKSQREFVRLREKQKQEHEEEEKVLERRCC